MQTSNFLSFKLSDEFVAQYEDKEIDWVFPIGGGNFLSEITFISKYSRLKEDGTKEKWHEVCRRCIEGMFSIQKDHCNYHRVPWNANKAQRAAEDAFDRMFHFKWTPPGRGLEFMGTYLVNGERNSAALQNCSFCSTEHIGPRNPVLPFIRLMEQSMYGIGVGFDTRGAGKLTIHAPEGEPVTHVVEDSREGWAASVGALLRSYFLPGQRPLVFDYSELRPAGAPLKRFGKTSAGPKPLMWLHTVLADQFKDRDGELLSVTDIVDINNKIGKAVVAGSARRSAEIAFGFSDDKEFLDLKNWDINPERMAQGTGWGHLSNNSVFAVRGTNLDHLVPRIALNGEPGIVWLDLSRDYGRLGDPPNYRDHRVAGYNPCVTADTWVMTTEGPRQVENLIGRHFTAVVDGKPYDTLSNGFWMTDSSREVFDLVTDEGWTVRLTDNHRVMTSRGWVEAGSLVDGDEIVLNHHEWLTWDGRGSMIEGYLLGHLWGDGYLGPQKAVLSLWGSDSEAIDILTGMLSTLPHRSDWKGFVKVPGRDEWRANSSALAALAKSFGMSNGSKKITSVIESASSAFTIGFLRAAFDTDGHVEGNAEKGVSIRLSQSDYDQLVAVQRMLARLGVKSCIRRMKEGGAQEMPGGTYVVSPSWRLIISGANTQIFMDRIGFGLASKIEKWETLTANMSRGFYRKPWLARFVALEYAGVEPVYDVTVEGVHAFDANGLYVHNCAEQSLENNELCTLVELFPTRHDSLEDFLRTVKVAYLYGKSVTLLPTPWPESNEVMQRNRRIGLSMTGIAYFADNFGWQTLKEWCDKSYDEVQRRDVQYSEWLGIRESIKTTTVKPSGTVSLVGGTWPGVHWPPAAGNYLRRQRFRHDEPQVELFREAGYHIEPDVMDPEFSVVVTFPTTGPHGRSEREVTIWEKMALAALMAKSWSDNAVSATFSFTQNEANQVGPAIRAFEGQMKTMSFLPMGDPHDENGQPYPQMPYEAVSEDVIEKMRQNITNIPRSKLYNMQIDAEGDRFCANDVCTI